QDTFPGLRVFTPSNSANWRCSSKYATSERPGYAASEHGLGGRRRRAAAGTSAMTRLVRRLVLGDDVRRDAAALIHFVSVGPGPLADSRALLAAGTVALAAAANLGAARFSRPAPRPAPLRTDTS